LTLATDMAQADADLAPADAPEPIETPDASEGLTPTPEGDQPPAAAEPPAASEAEAAGPRRNPDGTFAPKGETPAALPEPEAPAEPAAPDLDAYPAFTYRAEGRDDHELPGARQDDEGNVFVPAPAVNHLKQLLAYAHAYPRRDAEAQRSIAQVSKRAEAAEAQAQHVLTTFDEMFERGTWVQWAEDMAANWQKLKAEALTKGFEIQSKAKDEELAALRQRQEEVTLRPQMHQTLREAVEEWGKEAGLNDKERAQFYREWSDEQTLERLFPRADKDDPVNGIKAGQRVIEFEPLKRELRRLRDIIKSRTPAERKVSLDEENAKRTGQAGIKPPPTASVQGGKPAGTKPKTYKSTREADADIWR